MHDDNMRRRTAGDLMLTLCHEVQTHEDKLSLSLSLVLPPLFFSQQQVFNPSLASKQNLIALQSHIIREGFGSKSLKLCMFGCDNVLD